MIARGALLAVAAAAAVLLSGAPVPGQGVVVPGAVVTQGFGCTPVAIEPSDPSCPSKHFHSGIDLAAPLGTEVRAALPGTAQVIDSPTGYGLHVVVSEAGGLVEIYGHLSSAVVASGLAVSAGQVVGRVGSTGSSTGPHLHFEVRRDGRPVDPSPWLVLIGGRQPTEVT